MDYRILGKTGVKVSCLCLGTMAFGTEADEATSAAMYQRCREVGINFFDCANSYGTGRAEEILGKVIARERDDVVITSKVGSSMGPGVNDRGLARRHLVRQVEASLRRLNTDRIDLFFVHQVDRDTPMEEILRGLDDLVVQGKILYPGVSNWAAWQIARSLGVSERRAWARFECIQPMYSLAKRQAEVEILPLAASEQLGVIPYSPLGGGLLSGKYTKAAKPEQGRLVKNPMYNTRYSDEFYYEIAERFTAYARARSIHPATLAVAWVMTHPAVTAPIIGARTLKQLAPSLDALALKMTPEWRREVLYLYR